MAGREVLRRPQARWEAGEDFWCYCLPAKQGSALPLSAPPWAPVLGFLGRMWFPYLVRGTGVVVTQFKLAHASGSLEGLWPGRAPWGVAGGQLEPCGVWVVVLACLWCDLSFLLPTWEWGRWEDRLTQCPRKLLVPVTLCVIWILCMLLNLLHLNVLPCKMGVRFLMSSASQG